jgi:hypothetical protein
MSSTEKVVVAVAGWIGLSLVVSIVVGKRLKRIREAEEEQWRQH